MKVFIKGLNSCAMRKQKLRQYADFLVTNGHEICRSAGDSDTIIVWTCAFRGDVRDNSLAELKRYSQECAANVIAAGCLPDIAPEMLKEAFSGPVINWRDDREKMSAFFGIGKVGLDSLNSVYVERNLCEDTERFRRENPDKDATFHDQFVQLLVSEGCGFKCSYCSERLMFPAYRSFPVVALVEECRKVVEQSGKHEVILLADSLGEYGKDIGSTLSSLMRRLMTIHPRLRIALNNLNPANFIQYFSDMVTFLEQGRIRHLNLPIQSASQRVLSLMNRAYTRVDLDRVFALLNDIGFVEFDTHIIVGFPGEREEDFDETVRFILRHRPKYVLISRYMEAPEMPSAGLPDKVGRETMLRRSEEALQRIKEAGIICNSDHSDIARERLQRINKNSCCDP